MKLSNEFEIHFRKYLTATQVLTLSILVGLLNKYKNITIEKLASELPLPIEFASRRKHVQRFLNLVNLSIPLIWFPIINLIIHYEFKLGSPLIIALDRTQWKDINIFMIVVIWKHHGLPIYWNILNKRGASNFQEQKALIRPVLKLFNKYNIILIGDREFHSIELATWLKNENKGRKNQIDFAKARKI